MESDRQFVVEQIRERLRFYASITSFGFSAEEKAGPRPDTSVVAKAKPRDESLEDIRTDLGECARCRLSEKRRSIVFGVGNPRADLMFVGEGPGQEEDQQGIPFVGQAGQLLTKIIQAIDLTREQVYIANIVKCRPPNNREPEPDEAEACRSFLDRQIDAVRPKVICALGRVAALNLLDTDEGITRLRGRIFTYKGAKLVPTYHPAFLLRNPKMKRHCWEDMKLVRRLLQGGES